jgi:hypothetical protein
MKTIFTKTLKDGRNAEISFDGRSLYSATIDGAAAGSGHGVSFITARGFYAVGSVALTVEEKNAVEAGADAIRLASDRSQSRINSVSDARHSGDINKFSCGGAV